MNEKFSDFPDFFGVDFAERCAEGGSVAADMEKSTGKTFSNLSKFLVNPSVTDGSHFMYTRSS